MIRTPAAAFLLAPLLATSVGAQRSLHDARSWTLVVPPVGLERATERLDVEFATISGRGLALDLWSPPDTRAAPPRPAVVFLAGPADRPDDP